MAQLRVPASYDTIAEAVADASNGDVVIVSDGVYSEWVSSNLTYITIEAERPGCNVQITGDFIVGQGWTFKGLHIIHGLAEDAIFNAYGTRIEELHVLDCKLGLDTGSYAYWNLGNDIYTYRTEFYMLGSATAIGGLERTNAAGVTFNFWQACLFHDIVSPGSLITASARDKLYNCTFVNCDCTGFDYVVEPHTVVGCIFSTCAADIAVVASSTASSYDYNCFYNLTGTPNESSLATHEFVADPLLGDDYRPAYTSPCTAYTGYTTAYSQCYVSLAKVAYNSASGALGAFNYVADTGSMLYLRHTNIDPCDGLYVTYASTEVSPAAMQNAYYAPMELAWSVECSLSHSIGGTHLSYFIYDLAGHYRAFDNTLRTQAGTAANALFGLITATAFTDTDVTVGPLADDPHAYLLNSPIDEDLPGFVSSGQVDHYANGAVRALPIPGASNTRLLSFDGLSNKEGLTDTHTLYHLLGLYVNGGPMRVYRLWPTNMDRWTPTNRTGFDDIISPDTYNIDFPWYSNVLQRYTFKFEGLEYV